MTTTTTGGPATLEVPATEGHPRAADSRPADFVFGAGAYTLTCRGHRRAITTPADQPDALLAELRAALAHEIETGHPHPLVVGAVPFDPRLPARLFVPEHTTWAVGDEQPGVVDAPPAAGARLVDTTGEDYRAAVAHAVSRIRAGELDKVVLARVIEAHAPTSYDVDVVWARLRAADPDGFTFSVRTDGGHLVGASPELVAGTQGDLFRTRPLAGSARRGATPAEDEQITSALLVSPKDRAEHAVVVDEVVANLSPVSRDLRVPDAPRAYPTARMWHLGTEIAATLRPGVTSLEAALALHPTAAVCGQPRDRAAGLIAELEPTGAGGRGCYAGLVGWMDAHGNGTWALALRCAEISGRRARLFAGAGIVADSDPAAELAETSQKLRTMLDALGLSVTEVA